MSTPIELNDPLLASFLGSIAENPAAYAALLHDMAYTNPDFAAGNADLLAEDVLAAGLENLTALFQGDDANIAEAEATLVLMQAIFENADVESMITPGTEENEELEGNIEAIAANVNADSFVSYMLHASHPGKLLEIMPGEETFALPDPEDFTIETSSGNVTFSDDEEAPTADGEVQTAEEKLFRSFNGVLAAIESFATESPVIPNLHVLLADPAGVDPDDMEAALHSIAAHIELNDDGTVTISGSIEELRETYLALELFKEVTLEAPLGAHNHDEVATTLMTMIESRLERLGFDLEEEQQDIQADRGFQLF